MSQREAVVRLWSDQHWTGSVLMLAWMLCWVTMMMRLHVCSLLLCSSLLDYITRLLIVLTVMQACHLPAPNTLVSTDGQPISLAEPHCPSQRVLQWYTDILLPKLCIRCSVGRTNFMLHKLYASYVIFPAAKASHAEPLKATAPHCWQKFHGYAQRCEALSQCHSDIPLTWACWQVIVAGIW